MSLFSTLKTLIEQDQAVTLAVLVRGPEPLLGIKAVIAQSYERIHRNNLVGMGVLPLVFEEGQSAQSLGLDGSETYTISGIDGMAPRSQLAVKAVKEDGREVEFTVISRLDTEVDVEYFENGGILPCVIRKMMGE